MRTIHGAHGPSVISTMHIFLLAVSITLLTTFGGCSFSPDVDREDSQPSDGRFDYYFIGKIDDQSSSQLISALPQIRNIFVFSNGGYIEDAINIAEALEESPSNTLYVLHCLSACADYVLLGSDNIVMLNAPLVGFHGNGDNINALYNEFTGQMTECGLKRQDTVNLLRTKRGMKEDYSEVVQDKLNIKAKRLKKTSGACGNIIISSTIDWWFPDSTQLREIFGFSFEGSVAADDYDVAVNKILQSQMSGSRFLIGEQLYVKK